MSSKIQNLLNQEKKESFDDEEVEIKQTKGVRLNNNNSSVKNTAPAFNIKEAAYKALNNEEELKKQVVLLTTRLLTVLRDKELNENKNPEKREAERKVFTDYAEFARILNSAEQFEDCYGTLAYINAIARCFIEQRDRINELEYKLYKTEKMFTAIQIEMAKLKELHPSKE